MLYKKVKIFVPELVIRNRSTTNEILNMDKKTLKEILLLYINISGLLKSLGIVSLNVRDVKRDGYNNKIQGIFSGIKFNKIILSKGSRIIQDKFLTLALKECGVMLEEYLESCLLDKPELSFFENFAYGDFKNIDKVFTPKALGHGAILTYTLNDGTLIEVRNKSDLKSITKGVLTEAYENAKFPSNIRSRINLLISENVNFAIYKKIIIKGLELLFNMKDMLEDSEFLDMLGNEETKITDTSDNKSNLDNKYDADNIPF